MQVFDETDEEARPWWRMPTFTCTEERCDEEFISAVGLLTHIQVGDHYSEDGDPWYVDLDGLPHEDVDLDG